MYISIDNENGVRETIYNTFEGQSNLITNFGKILENTETLKYAKLGMLNH